MTGAEECRYLSATRVRQLPHASHRFEANAEASTRVDPTGPRARREGEIEFRATPFARARARDLVWRSALMLLYLNINPPAYE